MQPAVAHEGKVCETIRNLGLTAWVQTLAMAGSDSAPGLCDDEVLIS